MNNSGFVKRSDGTCAFVDYDCEARWIEFQTALMEAECNDEHEAFMQEQLLLLADKEELRQNPTRYENQDDNPDWNPDLPERMVLHSSMDWLEDQRS